MSYRTGSTPSNLRLSAPLLIDDDCQNAQSVSPKALRCAITVNHCSDGKSSLGFYAATHHERRIVRLLARTLSPVFLKFFTVAQRFTQLFQPHGGGESSSEDATMSPNSARSPAHLASQQHAHEKRRNCKTTLSAAHRSHNHQRRRHVTPSTSSESYGRAQRKKKKGGFRLRRWSARGLARSDWFTSCGAPSTAFGDLSCQQMHPLVEFQRVGLESLRSSAKMTRHTRVRTRHRNSARHFVIVRPALHPRVSLAKTVTTLEALLPCVPSMWRHSCDSREKENTCLVQQQFPRCSEAPSSSLPRCKRRSTTPRSLEVVGMIIPA